MASGSPASFTAAGPALDPMAETVFELGNDIGTGSSFKIVNQLLAGVHIVAACEAIVFAKSLSQKVAAYAIQRGPSALSNDRGVGHGSR